MLKKVSISFLLGLMVLSSFSFSFASQVSAANLESNDDLTVVVSGANKVVTVSFSVYATQTDNYDDFKDGITVKRSDASTYTNLDLNDTVAFSSSETDSTATLVVTFDNALTGSTNAIRIASDVLMDRDDELFDQVDIMQIAALDITPPVYTGSQSYNHGEELYLYFDENFTIESGVEETDAFLRSKMSIATDGTNFAPLSEMSDVYQYNSNGIHIRYDNDMQIILGANTKLKIASGTLKDVAGNLNEEMILDINPPVIQSVELSGDKQDVTITFNEDIYDNTLNGAASDLRYYISIFRSSNSNWNQLTDGETVSIVSGELVIHLAQALTGANNQIKVNGNALKDGKGNMNSDNISTPFIQGNIGVDVDTTVPRLLQSYMTNSNYDITMVFDEDVQNNKDSISSFISSITFPYDQQGNSYYNSYRFPSTPTVTFSGHILNFHFETPLDSAKYFSIPAGSIKDASNNVIQYNLESWLNPNQGLYYESGSFSNNGRWLNLDFNYNIMDNTLIGGVSHLKEKIRISTDNGASFSPIGEKDVISIHDDRLYILFNEPKKVGSVRVEIDADALRDQYGVLQSPAIDQTVAYNTPDVTGYFFSNAASEFIFEDNEEWRSKVKEVLLYDDKYGTYRPLNTTEYSLSAGKLTIKSGLFQKDQYYDISINADGYSSKYVEGFAYESSKVFFMTAPVLTTGNGITASINILNTYLYNNRSSDNSGTQTVVFELMNGATPVSIVTANLKVGTGTYSANFNVADAATNPKYSVRAFIVTRFLTDGTSIGTNLSTQATQAELDYKQTQLNNNNNNN